MKRAMPSMFGQNRLNPRFPFGDAFRTICSRLISFSASDGRRHFSTARRSSSSKFAFGRFGGFAEFASNPPKSSKSSSSEVPAAAAAIPGTGSSPADPTKRPAKGPEPPKGRQLDFRPHFQHRPAGAAPGAASKSEFLGIARNKRPRRSDSAAHCGVPPSSFDFDAEYNSSLIYFPI